MEYTTLVLPSSLLEEEDELLSVRILSHQQTFNPLLGLLVPPYIVVARVTMVIGDQETPTTLQTGLGVEGRRP
jgi:hypothetical protein